MSYDIEIRSDDRYLQRSELAPFCTFLDKQPDVTRGGRRMSNWVFERNDAFFMNIDLELVDEDGNQIGDSEAEDVFNRVRLHIPYARLRDDQFAEYMILVGTIADRLGWIVHDPQPPDAIQRSSPDRDNVEATADPNALADLYGELGLNEDAERFRSAPRDPGSTRSDDG
jgi:hypothetical protein